MQSKTDAELLREYTLNKSETAFGEIVRRYADFVYSAALRQVRDVEQARDVAQIVFTDLARKADSLRANTLLIGWLCHGARLAALEQLRNQQRRLQRERQAMELLDTASETPDDWLAVRPVLDEAIANLGDEDRNALLLRFFKNESLASVGTTLGVSEDAAQKRVSRALGKLREFLAGRGINTTAAALSLALAANAVQAAPPGFATLLTAGALAKTAVAPGVASLLKWFGTSPIKTGAIVLALAGMAGLGILNARLQHHLRETEATLKQQATDLDALRAANEKLLSQANELNQLRSNAADVLRLRSEVTQLRRQARATVPVVLSSTPTNDAPVSPAQITIHARFISIPAGEIGSVGEGTISSLDESQMNDLSKAMLEIGDSIRQSQSSITLLCGREAGVQTTKSVTITNLQSTSAVTDTNIGATLDVSPECSANSDSIDLNFVATLNDVVDLSAEDAPAGVPTSVFETISISNRVALASGETIVLRQKVSEAGRWMRSLWDTNSISVGPRSLLILITPTLIDAAGNRVFHENTAAASRSEASPPTETPPTAVPQPASP